MTDEELASMYKLHEREESGVEERAAIKLQLTEIGEWGFSKHIKASSSIRR